MMYFLAVAVAGSFGATAHLMLHYRRPTAAVAWLFALWFLPILGLVLYLMFAVYQGPRRVRRRRRLSRSLRSAEKRTKRAFDRQQVAESTRLSRVSERVAPTPLTYGNEVVLHPDARTARESVLACLRGARREILLESYIWTADEFTEEISRILREQVASGVQVRVLVDAIGSRTTQGDSLQRLAAAGVSCATFLAPNVFQGRFMINSRNHRKLLVVDGETAIAGGRNFAADYFDDGEQGIRDLSIRVRGPAVGAYKGIFLEDWIVATEGPDLELAELEIPAQCGETPLRVIPHGCDEERDAYVPIVSTALRGARESVLIVTPYLVPGATMLHDLTLTALSGVSVRILIPEHTPERWPEVAARRFLEPMLAAGIEIWIRPAPFMHAKAIVVDGCWTCLGSANFDQRSFYLNYELSSEIPSREFAQAVEAYFTPDFALSTRLEAERFAQRGWKLRLAENAAALFAPVL